MYAATGERPSCIRCESPLIDDLRDRDASRRQVHQSPQVELPAPHAASDVGANRDAIALAEPDAEKLPASASVPLRVPLSEFDNWELEEQLRHVERILSGARFSTVMAHTDMAERTPAPKSYKRVNSAAHVAAVEGPKKSRVRARVAWTIVGLGAAALAAGIALLSGGAVTGRSAWQSIGLPITLLGQVALLFGMMMQLDLVWHAKRETASKLYRFQKRLLDLESLAAELAPEGGEEPTSPPDDQALMAELKSRLDQLSHRLNVPCG